MKDFIISIPYSSIKRYCIAPGYPSKNQFQFHIVRLKENSVRTNFLPRQISIPYSSIKRICNRVHTFYAILFQFHIVRLKETKSFFAIFAQKIFQFHIVRLKALLFFMKLILYGISIPYSSIKRYERGFASHGGSISIPYSSIKSLQTKLLH